MEFVFELSSTLETVALAIVSGHGATDIDIPGFIWPYVAMALLPDSAVTPVFMASSLVHFSYDIGGAASAALHWLSFIVAYAFGRQRGAQIMFLYLLCVHTPMHFARAIQRRRHLGMLSAAVCTAAVFAALRGQSRATLGVWRQRVVVSHIANEMLNAL